MAHQLKKSIITALFAICGASAALALSGCGSSVAATVPAIGTTAILVHGAWADGSSWSKVTPLLLQRGLKVVSVQLQRASLADDAAIVRRAIEDQPGQVVLVGHSYGGAVITEAGGGSKVAALVYVAGFAPGDGESIADITAGAPPAAWQAGLVADSAGYLSLNNAVYLSYFAPDLSADEAKVLATSQGPVSSHILADKVSSAAWKTKPSFWALSGNDQIIPAAFQQAEASRIKAKVTLIGGASHVEMLSRPNEVANVILDAFASVGAL